MAEPSFGSADLRLPEQLRGLLREHLDHLRRQYRQRGWAGRVGFGQRPALVVIDMAANWTRPENPIGSDVESVLDGCLRVLAAARAARIPVYFTTYDFDASHPPSPHDRKLVRSEERGGLDLFELDPRLQRRRDEKLVRKRYASAFKGTTFQDMLTAQGIDTLIVTGISTSHCVYATCRDATDSFRVIVPREAVGERCELFHEVNLLDIDIDLGDVMPVDEVTAALGRLGD